MIAKEELKSFSAVTFDNKIYNFLVTPEGGIYCDEFDLAEEASIIELKPNFVLRRNNGTTIYSLENYARENNLEKSLVREWIIDDETYFELLNQRKLMFSTQMAIFYGFDPKKAFDYSSQKRAFKTSRNNEEKRIKVLSKMKKGQFN